MGVLSKKQIARREKTLIATLLLSMWAPIVTAIAVMLSHSSTQLADFIRRSVEFIALFISWLVFRHTEKGSKVSAHKKERLEKLAGFSMAISMGLSGIIVFVLTIARITTFEPGGNVYPGLAIAVLGIMVNTWFWRRYTKMTKECYNLVIDYQRMLYRAKAFVDFCVIIALCSIAVAPTLPATRYIDALGSLAVAGYLIWSGVRTLKTTKRRSLIF